jgi:hypothetical protein
MRIVVGHVHPGDSFALFRCAQRPLAPGRFPPGKGMWWPDQ